MEGTSRPGEHPDEGHAGDVIRAYDAEGREILIDREEYRGRVLPGQFRDAGDDADRLYDALVLALQDGFFDEALDPARRLFEVDPDRERATVILAIALMKTGDLDESEAMLEDYLARRGVSGVVLTNLAKVQAHKGKNELCEAVLWNALQADPNQDNGLAWWGALHYERGGEMAYVDAMRRAGERRGSWRPQLWLARRHLERDEIEEAVALYEAVLPAASAFGDALMMISGDLGNHGHPELALKLVGPCYDAPVHGALTGLNLIAACIQLGELGRGQELCNEVEGLERYDLIEPLAQLRTQLKAA